MICYSKVWLEAWGFPGSSDGKESASQCRRQRKHRLDPWVGKIPWRRKWQPTPIFLPEKSQGQRILTGYRPWGHRVRHDLATKQQRQRKIIIWPSFSAWPWGALRMTTVGKKPQWQGGLGDMMALDPDHGNKAGVMIKWVTSRFWGVIYIFTVFNFLIFILYWSIVD